VSYAGVASNLALAYQSIGNYGEAEPLFRRALKSYCAAVGREHPKTVKTIANVGMFYLDIGRLRKATLYFRAATRIREIVEPESSNHGTSLNQLGLAYLKAHRFDEAEAHLKRSRRKITTLSKSWPEGTTSLPTSSPRDEAATKPKLDCH